MLFVADSHIVEWSVHLFHFDMHAGPPAPRNKEKKELSDGSNSGELDDVFCPSNPLDGGDGTLTSSPFTDSDSVPEMPVSIKSSRLCAAASAALNSNRTVAPRFTATPVHRTILITARWKKTCARSADIGYM